MQIEQILEQIKALDVQNTPIEQAFGRFCSSALSNEEQKQIVYALLLAYTAAQKADLAARAHELEQAHFAFARAENALASAAQKAYEQLHAAGLNDVCALYARELIALEFGNLQLLSPTCMSAFIDILEEGALVAERSQAICSHLLLSSQKTLTPQRFLLASRLVLEPALELANLWQSYAAELLEGVIRGLYDALELLSERAIKELSDSKDLPLVRGVLGIEEDFRRMLNSFAGADFAGQILRSIIDNELESISARASRAIGRGRCVLGLRLSNLLSDETKTAAKKLQLDARELAKSVLERLKK